ncbi:MAG: nicotinate-nucleotide adenylyltransferase [Anaerolineae bacterium]
MKLGILGGTFDPIHVGHLLMAEVAWQALGLSRVLFVPAGDPPHKQEAEKMAAHHRRAMVAAAIADNPHFELSLIDLERPGPHYSVDTVRLVRAKYDVAADGCFFIIGGDSLVDLPKWYHTAELAQLCRLAVIHRPGYRPDLAWLENVIPGLSRRVNWVEMPVSGVSSSEIRARVGAGLSIRYQVAEPVRAYIEQHCLYQTSCG